MSSPMAPRYWTGDPGSVCDLCNKPITTKFVDAKLGMGGWGNVCPACHKRRGVGLGTGLGQEYTRQEDGRWLKTGG